jgi:hypothetical protein
MLDGLRDRVDAVEKKRDLFKGSQIGHPVDGIATVVAELPWLN